MDLATFTDAGLRDLVFVYERNGDRRAADTVRKEISRRWTLAILSA